MMNKANLYLSKKKKIDSLSYLTKYHRKSAILFDKSALFSYNLTWYILFMEFIKPWESLIDNIMKGIYYENIYANKRNS